MKQKLQLQIPEPCHENWNNMTETQQGRFCMSCKKEVIDFSAMSDKEILGYISTASNNMCGRANDDQLNRVIEAPREKRLYSFKYFWSVVITSALISNRTSAQIKPPNETTISLPVGNQTKGEIPIRVGGMQTIRNNEKTALQISGRVVDENNMPVPSASVIIKGTKFGTATDAVGVFSLTTNASLKNIELIVSSVGFTAKTIEFSKPDKLTSLKVEDGIVKVTIPDILMDIQVSGGVVVVKSVCSRKGKMTTGLMSTITRYTARDSIKTILGINEVKVYPNPIAINSNFNLGFNLKELGDYMVQFTDASGKIISSRQLNITSKNQLESFDSNIFQAYGMYFVSVRGRLNGKMYTTKILVQ